MSNYRLSASCRSEISSVIGSLCARVRSVITANFPLPANVIQRMLVTSDEEAMLRKLQTAGFKPLPVVLGASIKFNDSAFGLRRSVIVVVHNEAHRFWARKPFEPYYGYPGSLDPGAPDRHSPAAIAVPELVPPELMPALVKWIENQVTHLRMLEVLEAVSQKFFNGYETEKWLPTVGHCASRWPTALDLGRMTDSYKSHFNNPPRRRMEQYPWPPEIKQSAGFQKVLNMASQAVATAAMLPKVSGQAPEPYRALVNRWWRRADDWHAGMFS